MTEPVFIENMNRSPQDYKLPDGRITRDPDKMIREWRALIEPVADAFNLRLIGFDPDVLFQDRRTGARLELPTWFVKRLRAQVPHEPKG